MRQARATPQHERGADVSTLSSSSPPSSSSGLSLGMPGAASKTASPSLGIAGRDSRRILEMVSKIESATTAGTPQPRQDPMRRFQYDTAEGHLWTMLRWKSALTPKVCGHMMFWWIQAAHLLVWWACKEGYIVLKHESGLWSLNLEHARILISMTMFFSVFYTGIAYQRYTKLYDDTRQMLNVTFQVLYWLRTFYDENEEDRQHLRMATRFLLAQVTAFCMEVSVGGTLGDREWQELMRQGLLKEPEVNFLRDLPGYDRSCHLSLWVAQHVKGGKPANMVMKEIALMLERHRCLEDAVAESFDIGIPHPYFHIAIMMVLITLVLKGYTLAMTGSIFSPVLNAVLCMMLIGMLDLAKQLSDPFGTDDTDFPIDLWVAEMIEDSVLLGEYRYPEKQTSEDLQTGAQTGEFSDSVAAEVSLFKGEWYIDCMMGANRAEEGTGEKKKRKKDRVNDAMPETWLNDDAPFCKGVDTQIWLQTITPRAGLLREQRSAKARARSAEKPEASLKRNTARLESPPVRGRWAGAEFQTPDEHTNLAIAPAMGRRFTQAPPQFSGNVCARQDMLGQIRPVSPPASYHRAFKATPVRRPGMDTVDGISVRHATDL